jgi:hypothetical protein
VAKTGKPHTIVEDLILPAAMDMTGGILGERQKNYTMSSSNNFGGQDVLVSVLMEQKP